jgi:hypothetical protein
VRPPRGEPTSKAVIDTLSTPVVYANCDTAERRAEAFARIDLGVCGCTKWAGCDPCRHDRIFADRVRCWLAGYEAGEEHQAELANLAGGDDD